VHLFVSEHYIDSIMHGTTLEAICVSLGNRALFRS